MNNPAPITRAHGDERLLVHEAVALGHAFVSSVAQDHGIRALLIKGPILNQLNLREPRASSDVDVLVDPARRDEFVLLLRPLLWVERPVDYSGKALPTHAIHLINESWPCDIDVHDHYPGLFADKQAVFDRLWNDRTLATVANQQVPTLSLLGHIVIAALHSLRDPTAGRSVRELAFLNDRVIPMLSNEQRTELLSLCKQFRALETMRPFLTGLGFAGIARDLTAVERKMWLIRISDQQQSFRWLRRFADTPLTERPALVRQALFPPGTAFRAHHPATPSGKVALLEARISFIVARVAALKRSYSLYRRNRRL
ncbi:nucleotidyltransferase family protein [Subtercola sp. YIM 133946]|uniref:nucleotidyltransferase family protein n=1 Tax=Subtercola sp. YIM 133946 TaxID=3118909 RepID=UPI002F91EFDF